MAKLHSFLRWVILRCIYIHLYPFICRWTFRYLIFLAVICNATVNTGVHVSFWIMFCVCVCVCTWGFPYSSAGKESARNARDLGSILGLGRSLEKRTATHSSILAWRSLHILAVINNATVNIGVHVSFWVCVYMYRPSNTVAGSYGSSVFSWVFFFLRNLHIPQWLQQFTFPPQYMRICFPHILTISYWCSFWWQSFWQLGGDSSLWFWLAFPWWLVMLSIFSGACWLYVCPLWKNVYSGLLPIFVFVYSLGGQGLAAPCGLQDLSSPTRDWIPVPCSGSVE